MRQTVRLGRVAGIPLGLHWSVLVVVLLLVQGLATVLLPVAAPGHRPAAYWPAAVGIAGLFLLALLAHEVAHALTARHYGVRVKGITLWVLGGMSELEDEPPHPRAALLIALAGPIVSAAAAGLFAVAAVAAHALAAPDLLRVGPAWLAVVNAVMAVFNLLPGAPLDGGRVVAALVWRVRGDRLRGRQTAARAGTWIGTALVAAGVFVALSLATLNGVWMALVGWFLIIAARAEMADARMTAALAGARVDQVMSAPAVCGYTGQNVAGFVASVATRHPHAAYPVTDLDGQLAGVVTLDRLAAVPPAARGTTRLAELLLPTGRIRVLAPDTPLVEAVRTPAGVGPIGVVVTAGRPCGVLTAGDVRRAVQIVELGGGPDRGTAATGDPARTA